ncbi:serine-protein kinase ATM isoform X6 [Rattus norvegicus]|uniref:serine-protein kinase ATM isoform X6 n=1 Tax=Rattus norvegicus TaxID=10116 RepID=UPI00001CA4E2
MSLALNDLLICCRQLEHDRATERRKEVDKFKRLIQDPETVQHLDRHSDSKQGKYLNWDAVFRFLQKYIQKETESLRTAKSNVSASTQTSRQKKMQEISSLVRFFIKCANKSCLVQPRHDGFCFIPYFVMFDCCLLEARSFLMRDRK